VQRVREGSAYAVLGDRVRFDAADSNGSLQGKSCDVAWSLDLTTAFHFV
jgi:hypothetical protein